MFVFLCWSFSYPCEMICLLNERNTRKSGISTTDKRAELRTAYQVARLGTVSAAAEMLGFHRAIVNRHIDVLEAALGGRIFIRHARGYALTNLGKDVLRVAQKTEELTNDLAGRVAGEKAAIAGEIKLTMLAPFSKLLMNAIAKFKVSHPDCMVLIDVSDDLARLEYGEAHSALRAGTKPDHPDYVVSSFARVRFNLFAHDIYINQFGFPDDNSHLDQHKFVVPPASETQLPFQLWIKNHIKPEMIALSSRNIEVNLTAISAGIGMGFLGENEGQINTGLHRVLAPNKAWTVPLWLVTHVDLHRIEKVQGMLGHIKATLQEI